MKWAIYAATILLGGVLALLGDRWDVLSVLPWMGLFLVIVAAVFIQIHRVPESQWWVVERWGKATRRLSGPVDSNIDGRRQLPGTPIVLEPGFAITIRWIDKIVSKQSIQERSTNTNGQKVMAGGIEVDVTGVLYWKIGHISGTQPNGEPIVEVDAEDVYWATYGLEPGERDPVKGVTDFANSTLREVTGKIGAVDFDHLEDAQDRINAQVRDQMNPAMATWGLVVMRHEIVELIPSDPDLRKKLQEPLRAEKETAARIKLAEAEKAELIARAEGRKQEEIKEAEAQAAVADRLRDFAVKQGEGLLRNIDDLSKLHPAGQVAAIVFSSPAFTELLDGVAEGQRPQLPRHTAFSDQSTPRRSKK